MTRREENHSRRPVSPGRTSVDEATARRILGGAVVRRRERLELGQRECAERAGITLPGLVAIESGDAEPGVFDVARLAEVLECDIDELMGDLRWVPANAEDSRGHYEVD